MSQQTVKRRWTLTSVNVNNNKFWEIERLPATGATTVRWGRVGTKGQSKVFWWTESALSSKIREKEAKGYREIELHAVKQISVAGASSMSPAVQKFVEAVFKAANESISTFLATTVDALSVNQINNGRRELSNVSGVLNANVSLVTKIAAVQAYYQVIPTKLPARLRDADVQRQLVSNFSLAEQETRLNQLEAALATYVAGGNASANYVALGAEIREIPPTHPAYKEIVGRIRATIPRTPITGVFAVKIPNERAAYEAEDFGDQNISAMYHGTNSPNVRHILKSCLRVPKYKGHVSNGSRLGFGIYLSPSAMRSYQYTGGYPPMMFGVDAKLGIVKSYDGREETLRQAPAGYHSTMGTKAHGGLGDEFVVYKESQVTIRYVVTF